MHTRVHTNAWKHANPHHQQINTQLITGQMPFLSPNQQCRSTEGKIHMKINYTAQFLCGSLFLRDNVGSYGCLTVLNISEISCSVSHFSHWLTVLLLLLLSLYCFFIFYSVYDVIIK